MLDPELKNDSYLLPKPSKPRSSGLKEVSVKNNRSTDSFRFKQEQLSKGGLVSTMRYKNQVTEGNKSKNIHLSLNNQSQFLQLCPKPSFPQTQNTLILDNNIDSRIIFKMHSQDRTQTQSVQLKSKRIKIGSKAQKYRQNNKSQPKKVFDVENLVSQRQKQKAKFESRGLKEDLSSQPRKTQRKNSPNIFVCTKNTPVSSNFGTKLKKFEEDLKKTKKPHAMKLQLETARNDVKLPENKLKSAISLKNHQLEPKLQPFVFNDIKISPSPELYCNRISNTNPITPASKYHFSYGQHLSREQVNALERTKKITNNFIQNFEMISPRYPQEIQKKNEFYETGNIKNLMPANDINFVLERFGSNFQKISQNKNQKKNQPTPCSLDTISFPEVSLKTYVPEEIETSTKEIKIFTFKELENSNPQINQALTLRTTDYAKKTQILHDLQESALSQRRNTIFKTNEKTNAQKPKLQSLDEGAKTIITKYDSSQKRSIVDESIIIFQCSKDLKPSFSREAMDNYAARYRGSLGVETLIRENDEDENLTNERNSNYPDGYTAEQTGFENILFNPTTNSGKLRKSYSIKEVQASINL